VYEVSDQGRVRSYLRNRNAWNAQLPRILRGNVVNGYRLVVLTGPAHTTGRRDTNAGVSGELGRVGSHAVHRLVAEAFIPKPESDEYLEVQHKNQERGDNRAENLAWVTVAENRRMRREPGKNGWNELLVKYERLREQLVGLGVDPVC
jgi:hypothetical protein